jgi:hypothetical protein
MLIRPSHISTRKGRSLRLSEVYARDGLSDVGPYRFRARCYGNRAEGNYTPTLGSGGSCRGLFFSEITLKFIRDQRSREIRIPLGLPYQVPARGCDDKASSNKGTHTPCRRPYRKKHVDGLGAAARPCT